MSAEVTLITKFGIDPLMSKRIFLDEQGALQSDGSQCLMIQGARMAATRSLHRPDAALPVVIVSTATIHWRRTESSQPAMLGCIRAAGRLGTPHGKERPPRHSRQWGLTATTE
jgi:hypothetical protein